MCTCTVCVHVLWVTEKRGVVYIGWSYSHDDKNQHNDVWYMIPKGPQLKKKWDKSKRKNSELKSDHIYATSPLIQMCIYATVYRSSWWE